MYIYPTNNAELAFQRWVLYPTMYDPTNNTVVIAPCTVWEVKDFPAWHPTTSTDSV